MSRLTLSKPSSIDEATRGDASAMITDDLRREQIGRDTLRADAVPNVRPVA
jgi:hypothetical protein